MMWDTLYDSLKLDFWFLNSNEYFDDVRTEIGYFWQIQGIRDEENGLNQFRTIVSKRLPCI